MMRKKSIVVVFAIAITLMAYYLYDCFSYKEVKTNTIHYREIGSFVRYNVSYWDENFDNIISYSIISEDLNKIKKGMLKWNDNSNDAYICSVLENDCVWNKLAFEKGNDLMSLKAAISLYVMELENDDLVTFGGECLYIEFLDKKEHLFYSMKINEFPDSAEKANRIFDLLENVISD